MKPGFTHLGFTHLLPSVSKLLKDYEALDFLCGICYDMNVRQYLENNPERQRVLLHKRIVCRSGSDGIVMGANPPPRRVSTMGKKFPVLYGFVDPGLIPIRRDGPCVVFRDPSQQGLEIFVAPCFGAQDMNGPFLAGPSLQDPKGSRPPTTVINVVRECAERTLTPPVWVEVIKRESLDEGNEREEVYARITARALLLGEKEPRTFAVTYGWLQENGRNRPYAGTSYVEEVVE